MHDEESMLFEHAQLLDVLKLRAGDQLEHERRKLFGRARERIADKLVEEMAATRTPVLEGFAETAVILGGLDDRAAHDHGPTFGHVEQPHDVGVREPHAAGLREMANLIGGEGQALRVAERREPARDQIAHFKSRTRAAGD